MKAVAALRHQFGGHAVRRLAPDESPPAEATHRSFGEPLMIRTNEVHPTPSRTGPQMTIPTASSTKVILVSARPLERYGLRQLLGRRNDIRVLAEVATLRAAIRLLIHTAPHILLIDAAALDEEAPARTALREIRWRRPHCRVVAYARTAEVPVWRSREPGIARVLDQNTIGHEISDTLQDVRHEAERPPSSEGPANTGDVSQSTCTGQLTRSPRLTAREIDVLDLLVLGCTNREIGEKLYISPATAKFHVCSLIRKFDVSRRAQVAFIASRLDAPGGHRRGSADAGRLPRESQVQQE
jgi:DNA-binding NarL/FixJ family response regulator